MNSFRTSSPPKRTHTHSLGDDSNPFSSARLLISAPSRHTSPYALTTGPANAGALARAERAANAGGDDEDMALLLRGSQELSFGHSGEASTRLAPSTPLRGHPSPQQLQQPSQPPSAATPPRPPPSAQDGSSHFSGARLSERSASSAADPMDASSYELLKLAREGDCTGARRLLIAHTERGTPLSIAHADRDGDTALHRACAGGHLAMAQLLLLEAGADIHQTNHAGDTAALVNVQSAHPNTALLRFLIECGANLDAKNEVSG